jgi:hypothetical protein
LDLDFIIKITKITRENENMYSKEQQATSGPLLNNKAYRSASERAHQEHQEESQEKRASCAPEVKGSASAISP